MLRRQALSGVKRPVIVMTPKSLLRLPEAAAELKEFSAGKFQEIIIDEISSAKDDKILLCSGKIYYDLMEQKEKRNTGNNIAIIRLEQLYPLPEKQISSEKTQ